MDLTARMMMDGLCSLRDRGVRGIGLRFRSITSYTVKKIPTPNGQRRVSLKQNIVVFTGVFLFKNS